MQEYSSSKRDILWLAVSRFFYCLGFCILQPTLAIIFLSPPYSLSLSKVGIVLALFNFTDRGFAVFCSPAVKYFGTRLSQVVGFVMASACLILLVPFSSFASILFLLFFTGVGFSLSAVGVRAALSSIPDKELRLIGFSNTHVGLSAGGAVGFALAFLVPYQTIPNVSFFLSFLFILVAALSVQCGVSKNSRPDNDHTLMQLFHIIKDGKSSDYGIKSALGYVILSALALLFYYPFFDITPVYFEKSIGVPKWIGFVFSTSTLLVVFFQGWVTERFKEISILWQNGGIVLGFSFLAIGAITFGIFWSHWVIWIVAGFYAFAQMLIVPHIDYLISITAFESAHSYLYGLKITLSAAARAISVGLGMKYLAFSEGMGWGVQWWWTISGFIPLIIFLVLIGERLKTASSKLATNAR